MSLTDPILLGLLVVAAIAAIAATVVWWGRLAGPHWWRVLARFGALLGVNLLVLLAAGVALNDQYLFFSGWSDLLGTGVDVTVTAHAGGTTKDAFAVNAGTAPSATAKPTPLPLPPGSAPGDRLVTYQVHGAVSGLTSNVEVLLPSGYDSPVTATRYYPVVEAFPGYPGTPDSVLSGFSVQPSLDALVAQGAIAPSIWVIPNPEIPAGRDTECVNGGRGDAQVETFLAQDVPTWVRSHFRVELPRTSWATFGLSMGGWCASMVTLLHPAQFAAGISIAGYARPSWGNWHPYPAGDPGAARYDLAALASVNPPPVALWLQSTKSDRWSYPSTRALLKAARPPLSIEAHISSSGGHRWAEWTPLFEPAMEWLGHSVPGFMGTGPSAVLPTPSEPTAVGVP